MQRGDDLRAEAALAWRLRDAAVGSADRAPPDVDVLDHAALLAAAGHVGQSALLLDALTLARGAAAATPTQAFTLHDPRRAVSTLDLALSELVSLMAVTATPVTPVSMADDSARSRRPRAAPALPWIRSRLAALCAQWCGAVASPETLDAEELDACLAELRVALVDAAPIGLDARSSGTLAQAGACYAADLVRRGLFRLHDLAFPPSGSALVLACSAALHPAGLGPYFCNVGTLVEGWPVLIAFVEEAATRAAPERCRAMADRFVVLIAATTPIDRLQGLVEALASRGIVGPLAAIAARLDREGRGACDRSLLWMLRDAALDGGDPTLALSVQQRIVGWWPAERVERLVLGEMLATSNRTAEAAATFDRLLDDQPGDEEARQRQDALQRRDFARFATRGGIATRPARQTRDFAFHRARWVSGVARL